MPSSLSQLAQDPKAFDEKLADLHERLARAHARRAGLVDQAHSTARDRKEWKGRRQVWVNSDAWAFQQVQLMVGGQSTLRSDQAEALLGKLSAVREDISSLGRLIQAMSEEYGRHGWSRFFPCDTRGGHIHSELRGSSAACNISLSTAMGWYPSLSGKTQAEAVAELGEALCTFCFPDAPSDWKAKTLGQVRDERTRAEREAAQAARLEKKYAKALRPDECFKVKGRFGDRIETVAACKEVLRKEVEYRDYLGHGEHSDHAAYVAAAQQAAGLLLRRESFREGTGATQAQIDTIIANAVKRCIRDGARLNPDGSVKAA